ncbi:MAG: tRNA pseudouridine(38-40) synthase TruA [Rhodothermales bacterium]
MKYKLLIEYDGTDFSGWQRQAGAATVQETLENALAMALRHDATVVGSGRTDAGVHARGQVAHFETPIPIEPTRLRGSLNGLLPETIAVRDVTRVDDAFHARYDAVSRTYHYYVTTIPHALERRFRAPIYPPPDFDRMNEAATALVGTFDFNTFCRTASDTQNRICTVTEAGWIQEEHAGAWRFRISANRFLHGMVRAIVGTLVEIGHGKRAADSLPDLLARADRRAAGPAAPARGLVLEHVTYPDSR